MTASPAEMVLWAGLVIGLAFGVTGMLSGFCLMSGLRGWWWGGDARKIRTFALALAVALAGSQALAAMGLVDLGRSLYMQPSIAATIALGGALFGYGMVMANGCGARSLVLLGGGNLRSLVVLLCLGIAAHTTLTGLIAPWRADAAAAWAYPASVTPPTVPAWLAARFGLGPEAARWLVAGLMAGVLALFAFAHRPFRTSPGQMLAGVVVGLLVVAGWYATGRLGADDFDPAPLASLTFVAPIGDTIQYAMLATGTNASFGVMVVAGVVLGALPAALVTRRFSLEGFTSPRSMLRYMGGGVLMGVGGALAFGCSIGQGLTGLSTLALASFPAALGILAGAALGLSGPVALAPPQP